MHDDYGGVVPELASRDHIRRLAAAGPRSVLAQAGARARATSTRVAYTEGPGWPARCWSAPASRNALAYALGVPAIGIHHLEGHLLSPLLSARAARVSVRRAARSPAGTRS